MQKKQLVAFAVNFGIFIHGIFLLYHVLTHSSTTISSVYSNPSEAGPYRPEALPSVEPEITEAEKVLLNLKYPPFVGEIPPNSECYIFSPLGSKTGKGVLFFAFGMVYHEL
jgi:hypothetical protein